MVQVRDCEQNHDLTGDVDYLTTAQAVEQLQHNLETDHCLLCDFMSIAYQQVHCSCAWVQVAWGALAIAASQPPGAGNHSSTGMG